MSDDRIDGLQTRIDGLQADMELRFATVDTGVTNVHRAVDDLADETRKRITTAETTMVNEIRRLADRLGSTDSRLAQVAGDVTATKDSVRRIEATILGLRDYMGRGIQLPPDENPPQQPG